MRLCGIILGMLCLIGCAPHRPVQNDFARGHIINATWPCTVNAQLAMVDCDCAHFHATVDAKTGNTVLRCPENRAQ